MLKILSTGLEGPERSALDAAIHLKYPWGGTAPLGRSGQFSPIPEKYFTGSEFGALVEGTSSRPMQSRTQNALAADATLIVCRGRPVFIPPLCKQTMITLRHHRGIYKDCDPTRSYEVKQVVKWLVENEVKILNVSSDPKSPDDPFTKRSTVFMRDILNFTALYYSYGAKIWTA